MSRARYIDSLEEMDKHDVICITGGEPQLRVDRILEVINWARELSHKPKLYMYTTIYTEDSCGIAQMIDGIHYSIHAPMTNEDYKHFCEFEWGVVGVLHKQKSFRLYIESSIEGFISFHPSRYQRIEAKGWQTEDELLKIQPYGIPAGETMYIWRE